MPGGCRMVERRRVMPSGSTMVGTPGTVAAAPRPRSVSWPGERGGADTNTGRGALSILWMSGPAPWDGRPATAETGVCVDVHRIQCGPAAHDRRAAAHQSVSPPGHPLLLTRRPDIAFAPTQKRGSPGHSMGGGKGGAHCRGGCQIGCAPLSRSCGRWSPRRPRQAPGRGQKASILLGFANKTIRPDISK